MSDARMTVYAIMEVIEFKLPLEPILEKLLGEGLYKTALDQAVADMLNLPLEHPKVEITRMNIIAQLRGLGYIVSGGMKGRKDPYKILRWEIPFRDPDVTQWSKTNRELLWKYTEGLPELSEHDWGWLRGALALRPFDSVVHENTWLYYWGYEAVAHSGSREKLFVYEGKTGYAIIGRKFFNVPRLRILQVDLSPEELFWVGQDLAEISLRPVIIKNLLIGDLEKIREMDPKGLESSSHQQWYDTHDIAENPRKYLSHGSWNSARKAGRDLTFVPIEWDDPQAAEIGIRVISKWKTVREESQRQLAVGRDFACAATMIPQKYTFVGIRNGIEVAYSIYETLPNRPDVAAHLVEKSMNWGGQFGGLSGTSDWMLHQICEYFSRMGVNFINAGESSEVSTSLHQYKMKYSVRKDEPVGRYRILSKLVQGRRAR